MANKIRSLNSHWCTSSKKTELFETTGIGARIRRVAVERSHLVKQQFMRRTAGRRSTARTQDSSVLLIMTYVRAVFLVRANGSRTLVTEQTHCWITGQDSSHPVSPYSLPQSFAHRKTAASRAWLSAAHRQTAIRIAIYQSDYALRRCSSTSTNTRPGRGSDVLFDRRDRLSACNYLYFVLVVMGW